MEDPTKRNLPIKRETRDIATMVQHEEVAAPDDLIRKMIPQAGTLNLTDAEMKILYAEVNPEYVEVRPDGMVYMPWMEYVSILRNTFGGSWGIIPDGKPVFKDNHVYWGFYLMIRGTLAGYAIGDQAYKPDNARMTYGDAMEGAKSNAITRLCKGIGIGLELWRPSFIRTWRKKYAEEYETTDRYGKKVTLWRRVGSTPPEAKGITAEVAQVFATQSVPAPPAPKPPSKPTPQPPPPKPDRFGGGDEFVTCGGANPKLSGKNVSSKFCDRCFALARCDVRSTPPVEEEPPLPFPPPVPEDDSNASVQRPTATAADREGFFKKIQQEMGRVGMSSVFDVLAMFGHDYANDVPPGEEENILRYLNGIPKKPEGEE